MLTPQDILFPSASLPSSSMSSSSSLLCRIGYMEQPGHLSLAQSHICAHGCRRVMPTCCAGLTARLLQISNRKLKTGRTKSHPP